ncbi:MAG: hypothetical protein OXT09_24740 [Myxococcales bacterium]|nr:hypothetical protein [Myxococcales bacterium]
MREATKTTLAGMLALAMITLAGCEEVKDVCEIGCSAEGLAEGNASITGVRSLDGFFAAVLRFDAKAAQIGAGLDAELQGLAADFGIDAATLQADFGGDVGAALSARFEQNLDGELRVRAEPPRCDVDARAELSASAQCQVEAGCEIDVDPGSAMLECHGSCEAEVRADVQCEASAELVCSFRGPAVACSGECKGRCSAMLDVAASCDGTCTGTCTVMLDAGGSCDGVCNGSCDGNTDAGGVCDGTCTGSCELDASAGASCEGVCEGTCEVAARAGAACEGTCSGECTARGPDLDCSGAAEARCEAMGEASVSCQGECRGELEPPTAMAQCEAAASCDAQARADASVEVECSEPALDVEYALRADLDAEVAAQMELGMRQLGVRLPRILARLEQATLLVDASAELGAAATGTAEATVDAFSGGNLGVVAALRVVECAPAQLEAVPGLIAGSTAELQASLSAAVDVRGAVGL